MKRRILKSGDDGFKYYRGRDLAGWYFPYSRFARVLTPPLSSFPEYVGVMCPCSICEFNGTCKDCPNNFEP